MDQTDNALDQAEQIVDQHQGCVLRVVGLDAFLETREELEDSLARLVEQAAGIMKGEKCSIMLFDDETFGMKIFAKHGPLPRSAMKETVQGGDGIAGQVAASGKPLLVEDIEESPYLAMARRPESPRKGFICVPIGVADKVVGVLNVSDPVDGRRFCPEDLTLATFLANVIGKTVQVMQLQKLLRSRYLQAASGTRGESPSGPVPEQDAARIAQILARSFYREMAAAGFGADNIITAATEIISQLNSMLARHRARRERQG